MPGTELKNKEIIAKLQELGVQNINPTATKPQLLDMLAKAQGGTVQSSTTTGEPKSDMERIMAALGGLAENVEKINQRVTKMEDGGKNDFKMDIKQDDIDSATESKKNADPRVVEIVEQTLGVDFGVKMEQNPNSPGFTFTVLVPKRLSPIPTSTRPIVDSETGAYKIDPKMNSVIEEPYWPGDRRSRAVGSTDSFDLIREHCNKVRAHIVTYYEKAKKPLPEFKLK